MKVKSFSESQCTWLVTLVVAGNMCGQLFKCWDGEAILYVFLHEW